MHTCRRTMATALIVLSFASSFAVARVDAATTVQIDQARDRGLAWLVRQQRGDGSWRSVSGTEVVATATAIEAFDVASVKTEPYAAGVAWLANATVVSVDSLARQITSLAMAGLDVSVAARTLVSSRNTSLAWGAYEGFDTTFPDTALAIAAIRAAALPETAYSSDDLKQALCRILVSQKTTPVAGAGSWSYTYADALGPTAPPAGATTSAILPTVYNLLEVDAVRVTSGWNVVTDCPGASSASAAYDLSTAVASGVNWLTARQNPDGGFGEGGISTVLETALAYHALATLRPAHPAAGPALDYLIIRTAQPDGSWNGDVLQTALVLKVVPVGTPYADADGDGVPDRVETHLSTDPGTPDSRWMAAGNGLTSFLVPSPANDFGIIITRPSLSPRTGPPPILGPAPAPSRRPGLGRGLSGPEAPDPLALTVSTEAFDVELYTGGAVAELPIAVPVGAGGVAPTIVLRYDSLSADTLTSADPAPGTGLGWTLVTGPVIVRDHKKTRTLLDDSFTLVFGGRRYELELIDAAAGTHHTRDETFLKLRYDATADTWTLSTKDGTRYELGKTGNSRQKTLVGSQWTAVTYRYLISEMRSASGVAVTYTYSRTTATVDGVSYDQSINLDTVTWASYGGEALGTSRQATFIRSARTDWPLSPNAPKHFDRKKLDAIEIRIGGTLLRTYELTYDYTSIDRTPGTTWSGGGGSGDLALRSLRMVGTDGATALPAATFEYDGTSGRLTRAENGLGGQVTYAFDTAATAPLYSTCSTPSCTDRRVGSVGNPTGFPAAPVLGYLLAGADPDTVPICSACLVAGASGCTDWGAATTPSGFGATLLGYAHTTALPQVPGTIGLYSVNEGDWKAVGSAMPPPGGTLLGYIYPVSPSRYGRVATRSVSDGRTAASVSTYVYSDVALNADGSIRGHASARRTDPSGTYVNTYFRQSDDLSGRVYRADTFAGSTLVRRVANGWTVTAPYPTIAPDVTLATLSRTDITTYDGDVARTIRRTWQYDDYANVTVARSEGDLAVTGDEREERTYWLVDEETWLHRPSRVVLRDAAGATLRERWLSYDNAPWGSLGTHGLLTHEERRLAGARTAMGNPVTTTSYDAYGNVLTATDAVGCATTTAYDAPTHAVPTAITTCLGHVTAFAYDAYLRRTTVTDPNNQVTTYAFDALGRLRRITGPLDTAAPDGSVRYQYLGWGDARTQVVRARRPRLHGEAATTWVDEYFDGRGRVYAWQSSGPGAGQVTAQAREFDARGWIGRRSAAYLVGVENPAWTTYARDSLGRVTRATYPDSTSTETEYGTVSGVGGLATVTDERGAVKRLYSDAYDQLVQVDEVDGPSVGTTRYAHDAAGQLTAITSATGEQVTFEHDALGRRIEMTDANLGTWTWGYDPSGNVVSRTNARGQTTTFAYDEQGRIRAKTSSTAQVTWTYDEPNPSGPYTKGRLTTLTDPVSRITFAYDRLGRVTRASRLLDGTTYVLQQTYDAGDRVSSRTYPDGETVTFVYNDAGWLERIPRYLEALDGTVGLVYNARGQRTRIAFGNGAITTLAYHPTSFRLVHLMTHTPSGTLQNLSYTYDAAGNLTGIDDSAGTASRRFEYDALNRLTRAGGRHHGAVEDYAYDAAGNVAQHGSLVYAYAYAAHPWAVSAVADGRTYTYDANGNARSAAGRTLTWDADGQLQAVTRSGETLTFAYDGLGQRVMATAGASVTRSPFPGFEIDPQGVSRTSLGLAVKHGASVRYYHDDHLGSTHVITDSGGIEVQRVEYDAWGAITRSEGTVDRTVRFRTAEGAGSCGCHYDPSLGRMLATEPSTPDLGNPQALNPYSYAGNNPVTPGERRPDGGAPGF